MVAVCPPMLCLSSASQRLPHTATVPYRLSGHSVLGSSSSVRNVFMRSRPPVISARVQTVAPLVLSNLCALTRWLMYLELNCQGLG
jgi:hypothetical protein